MDQAELKIASGTLRAALDDEAAAALPDGPLKELLLLLSASTPGPSGYGPAELYLRWPATEQKFDPRPRQA
jgi:hypothetical protein